MKTSSLLVSGLLFGALGLGVGVGGCTATVYNPQPAPPPPPAVAEEDADAPADEVVVEEEVVEIQDDPKIVYVEIETGPDYFAHHARLHGPGIVNFNTGYADGWAAATFFNHGQPLADYQIDRLLDVGRRQGDPTGKLALPGYQEGYRAGARHYHNPYRNRLTAEQWARQREVQGLPARPFPGRKVRPVLTDADRQKLADRREDRRKELDAAKAKIDAERKAREQAFDQREAERKAKLDAAKNDRELARNQRDAARDQREAALKAKLEADKKAREDERQKQELARKDHENQLKAKLEAEKKAREAEHQKQEQARKDRDASLKAKTEAARAKQEAERKQRELARQQKKDEHKEKVAQRKEDRLKDKGKDKDKNKDGEDAEASVKDKD